MELHAASQAAIIDTSALSRKPSPTRAYLFHRAPHLCGDQEMCQANGLTCAVLRKPPGSENEWQLRIHGAFTISHDTLGITRRNQSCHTKFGFTSSTLKPAGLSPILG